MPFTNFDSRHFATTEKTAVNNAKILHDWDNYQASLTDYDYAKYKASTQAVGYQTKVNELAQFFTGGTTTSAKNKNTDETSAE